MKRLIGSLVLVAWADVLVAATGARVAELTFDQAEEIPSAAHDFVANARVVWLGEMHGTNEAPDLFLGLVRLVAKHDAAPVVALAHL